VTITEQDGDSTTYLIRGSGKKPYRVLYQREVWATSQEDAYEEVLSYLSKVVGYDDLTAFLVEEVAESEINNKEENV
jgi:hypothetical protein